MAEVFRVSVAAVQREAPRGVRAMEHGDPGAVVGGDVEERESAGRVGAGGREPERKMATYEMSVAICRDRIVKSRSRRDVYGGILRNETAEASRSRSFSTHGRPPCIDDSLGVRDRA
jgi:hypothetical protein